MKKKTKKVIKKLVKRNRRNKSKYPALKPDLNLKTRTDLIDYDYLDKLSDKEKAWLNSFTEEYVGANMKHKGKKFHKTKAMKKDCYDRNNARNRCIYTKAKASGQIDYLEDLKNTYSLDGNTPEDELISLNESYDLNHTDEDSEN